jgi:hypothetical protein
MNLREIITLSSYDVLSSARAFRSFEPVVACAIEPRGAATTT